MRGRWLGCGVLDRRRQASGGSEDRGEDGLRGSLALQHLVLLLCGLANNLGSKRNPIQWVLT